MRQRLLSKLAYFIRLLRSGDVGALWADVRRWTWSDDRYYGLRRDMTVPYSPPPARIEFSVQPLDSELADVVLNADGLPPVERREIEHRRRIWESHIGTAFVALDGEGHPCYVQWAIPGAQADRVDRFFGGTFPHLAPDELLLEGAWALPRARGQRIMSDAMSQITVTGAGSQHSRAITFVGVDNEPSLRGCYSAGFQVYVERLDSWRFGRRRVRWTPATAPVSPPAPGTS